MAGQGKPIEPKVKERVAELIGLGLTPEEAAGAKGISRPSVDRIMSQPEYRKQADDILRSRTSMKAEMMRIVRASMYAVDDHGRPLFAAQRDAVKLYATNPELFDDADAEEREDTMLPGVTMRFPVRLDPSLAPGTVEARQDGDVKVVILNADEPEPAPEGVVKQVAVIPVSPERLADDPGAESAPTAVEDGEMGATGAVGPMSSPGVLDLDLDAGDLDRLEDAVQFSEEDFES